MTQAQLETRKERSENGALIASATEEGFRVYAVRNPSKIYLVRKEGDQWTCTCPDFDYHKGDITWRCKHVLAVAPWPKPEETLPVEVEFDDPTQGLSVPDSPAPDQVRRKGSKSRLQTPHRATGRRAKSLPTPVARTCRSSRRRRLSRRRAARRSPRRRSALAGRRTVRPRC